MIAAPSANTSGRPSPTKAGHVYEDMKGRIPIVLDGGAVGIGIESTIIDMSQDMPVILRPGYISRDQLMAVAGRVEMDPAVSGKERPENVVAKAPGMKYRHYAPRGRMILVEGEMTTRRYTDKNNIDREVYEVVADRLSFTGEKVKQASDSGYYPDEPPSTPAPPSEQSASKEYNKDDYEQTDDDYPF